MYVVLLREPGSTIWRGAALTGSSRRRRSRRWGWRKIVMKKTGLQSQ